MNNISATAVRFDDDAMWVDRLTLWPVSTRVNSPKNDDAGLIEPAAEADATAPPDGNSA